MRVLIVGATGTIGSAIVKALEEYKEYAVIRAGHTQGDVNVDIADVNSIRAMYAKVGRVDAVISAAGSTRRKAFLELTDDDYAFSLANKLMGQVNLVRYGIDFVEDGGSFTLTSGVLGRDPIPGSEAISIVNLGLEGFMNAASREMPRGLRVNVVSPPWVSETLKAIGMEGQFPSLPAAKVAKGYLDTLMSRDNGRVVELAA